ncbi:MAG TPA: ribonuclease J [Alphaproteobacteria bacterium]|nr:ribonuclease J [Alphaproteobacteria bacterium]
MGKDKALHRPGNDGVYFLPLGGAGEIGMNLSLYGTEGKWLMVDLGVTFGDDTMPGIDVVMPDPTFIADRKDDLIGIVLTHGHEDHLGAIEYLWPQLQCPVYATPFTAGLLRAKLAERDVLPQNVRIIEVPNSGKVKLGPFEIQWISITHSIPESNCLAIKTKHGTVLHTGDWKLDASPMLGEVTNEAALKALGAEGVLAAVVDSTNALVPGWSGSEKDVRENLKRLFGQYQHRIIVTCFASNVARLMSIYDAAKAHGREVALVGRSLWRIEAVARDTGYIPPHVMFLEPHEAGFLPRDKAVYICTGSQGEKRSALARLAAGEHHELALEEGDTVLYSSREIPGNEKAIAAVQNSLIRSGLRLVTINEEPIHVSGHPCQDELVQMYQWLRPQVAVPVHGEARHQAENARMASMCQVPQTIVPNNGEMYRLGPGKAEKVGEVQAGRWALDGLKLRPLTDATLKARQKMMGSGVATVSLVVNEKGQLLVDPQVSLIGLGEGPDADDSETLDVRDAVIQAFQQMPKSQRLDDVAIQHSVRQAVRRTLNDIYGRKPITEVHVVRV